MIKEFFLRYGVPNAHGSLVYITYDDAAWAFMTASSVHRGYYKKEVINHKEFFGFEMPDPDSVVIAAYLLTECGYTRTSDHK